MADEWFRSGNWTPEAQEDFEARLKRARSYSRPQYLRIKGLALAAAGEVAGARQLWNRVLDSTDELASVQQFSSLEHLGDSYANDDPLRAEQYFRRLIAENPTRNGTSAMQEVKLAELLTRKRDRGSWDEAADLLIRWKNEAHVPFPNAHFRWELAAIDLAERFRDRATAREAARRALDLADRGPVFPRHKIVGLVEADKTTLKRLKRLAR